MIHQGQLEVFDLTLTAKAPVFIGSGKSYVKKEYVFLTPRSARVSCDEVMLLDETKFFHLLLERKLAAVWVPPFPIPQVFALHRRGAYPYRPVIRLD